MSFSKCRDRDSRSRSRQKSRFYSISHVETSFFELSRLVSTVETFFLKLSRISRQSRLTFKSVEIETLDRDHVETNRDHQGYKNLKLLNLFCKDSCTIPASFKITQIFRLTQTKVKSNLISALNDLKKFLCSSWKTEIENMKQIQIFINLHFDETD
jgi:hypothetical protein